MAGTSSAPWWVMERCGSCRGCTSEPCNPSPLVQIETGDKGGCLAGQICCSPWTPGEGFVATKKP